MLINRRSKIWKSLKKLELYIMVVDIGSDGGRPPVWEQSDGAVKFCDFEARGELPRVAFSDSEMRELFVTRNKFCSSLFEPNKKLLEDYETDNVACRDVMDRLSVKCCTLDDFYNEKKYTECDFIKIDTQGSELDILKGAKELLKGFNPIVYAETWTREIYEKTPLSFEIMSYMHKNNYELLSVEVGASWKNLLGKQSGGKKQVVGLDLIFIPNNNIILNEKPEKFIKYIAILELYGYYSLATHLLELYNLTKPDFILYKDAALRRMNKNFPNWFTHIWDYTIGNLNSKLRVYPKLYD